MEFENGYFIFVSQPIHTLVGIEVREHF